MGFFFTNFWTGQSIWQEVCSQLWSVRKACSTVASLINYVQVIIEVQMCSKTFPFYLLSIILFLRTSKMGLFTLHFSVKILLSVFTEFGWWKWTGLILRICVPTLYLKAQLECILSLPSFYFVILVEKYKLIPWREILKTFVLISCNFLVACCCSSLAMWN